MKQIDLNEGLAVLLVQAYMNDKAHKVGAADQKAIQKVLKQAIAREIVDSMDPRAAGASIRRTLDFGKSISTGDKAAAKFFNAATVRVQEAVDLELARVAARDSLDSKKAARVVGGLIRGHKDELPEYWDDAFVRSEGRKGAVFILYDYEMFAGSSKSEDEHVAELESWIKQKLSANPKWASFTKLDFDFYSPDAT